MEYQSDKPISIFFSSAVALANKLLRRVIQPNRSGAFRSCEGRKAVSGNVDKLDSQGEALNVGRRVLFIKG